MGVRSGRKYLGENEIRSCLVYKTNESESNQSTVSLNRGRVGGFYCARKGIILSGSIIRLGFGVIERFYFR